MGEEKVRLKIEVGGLTQTFEGNMEEAFKFVFKFMTQIYPGLKYVSKFIYSPDYSRLFEELTEYVKLTDDRKFMFTHQPESAEQAIGILLLAASLSSKMGLREKCTMSTEEMIQYTDKAPKTIRNTLAYMVRTNVVERVSKGEYGVTLRGFRWMEDTFDRLKSHGEGG